MIILYFQKSQFENIIDCFTLLPPLFPPLFRPAPPPSPPGPTAKPIAMSKSSWDSTVQDELRLTTEILTTLHIIIYIK